MCEISNAKSKAFQITFRSQSVQKLSIFLQWFNLINFDNTIERIEAVIVGASLLLPSSLEIYSPNTEAVAAAAMFSKVDKGCAG
uniref:Uncharacterized protein n=1 Tax=Oryza brachyantha TaxID=4533 RepID=J3LLA8_ORYBR